MYTTRALSSLGILFFVDKNEDQTKNEGQTTRYYNTRVHKHLNKKSQPSSIFKHLEAEVKCRDSCDEPCFEIIDTDTSAFRLEIKEAIHNEWVKPNINKQKNLLKLSILI